MEKGSDQVFDGSELMELVGNEKVFDIFVDRKFKELDKDQDGKLSIDELKPAVADIGAALGLPADGSSAESDAIYSEVLNEFTHGKQDQVSKTDFKEVLSDILIGMAAGLKRDPIVILRMDGEDLRDFISSSIYELEMASIFSQMRSNSAPECFVEALGKLTVDNGMPPADDPWVRKDIVEPAVGCFSSSDELTKKDFLDGFKEVAGIVADRMKENPVIVGHSANRYDGTGLKRLLSTKYALDKSLNAALSGVPRSKHGEISKDYLRVVLDAVGPSAGLPPLGGVEEIDRVIGEVLKMVKADDGKLVKEREFKKLMLEMLGSILLQLEANPVSVSTNSVVHEPLVSSSSLFNPHD